MINLNKCRLHPQWQVKWCTGCVTWVPPQFVLIFHVDPRAETFLCCIHTLSDVSKHILLLVVLAPKFLPIITALFTGGLTVFASIWYSLEYTVVQSHTLTHSFPPNTLSPSGTNFDVSLYLFVFANQSQMCDWGVGRKTVVCAFHIFCQMVPKVDDSEYVMDKTLSNSEAAIKPKQSRGHYADSGHVDNSNYIITLCWFTHTCAC